MNYILKLICVFLFSWGLLAFIFPNLYKKLIIFFLKGYRVYHIAGLYSFVGTFSILASDTCQYESLVLFTGGFLLLFGILLFFTPLSKWHEMLLEVLLQKNSFYRMAASFDIIIAVLLFQSI